MNFSGTQAFAYAKACGIMGRSFLGNRTAQLEPLTRLMDLQRLLFPEQTLQSGEVFDIVSMEQYISTSCIRSIRSVLTRISGLPRLLGILFRSYEYADLKNCLTTLASGSVQPPSLHAIGPFAKLTLDAFPDLDSMLRQSEFEWILESSEKKDLNRKHVQTLLNRIDRQYYTELWQSAVQLPLREISGFRQILDEEIELKNILWALRLKNYYHFSIEEIQKYLIQIPGKKEDDTASALACLANAQDQRKEWKGWKWESLLNPELPGSFWYLDPRFIQNTASRYIYQRLRRVFRRKPLSIDSFAAFIRLKQFEEDLLISIAEGLSLGLNGRESLNMLELRS